MPDPKEQSQITSETEISSPVLTPTKPHEAEPLIISKPHSSGKKKWLIALVILLVFAVGAAAYLLLKPDGKTASPSKTPATSTPANTATESETVATATTAHVLDAKKNYGNKYANGFLPVGDSKYVTDKAKKGSVYVCSANFVPASQAGAQTRGPWFTSNNTQWDLNKKLAIQGKVTWQSSMSVTMQDGKRVITTNDLPTHTTGVFPVAANDPARSYDANPNSIKAQSLTYTLAASPTVLTSPTCMTGEVGVMLTGVALYNAFDAGGRDAGAWEVQDGCDGHPQSAGAYHYHTMSRCITDVSVQKVIGFALDGFPITGPKVGEDNLLTTDDLDECHGITSEVVLDDKKVTTYHYVMTQDFPYSVSCFRGTAVKPPGQPETTGGGQGQGQPGQKSPSGMPPPPR